MQAHCDPWLIVSVLAQLVLTYVAFVASRKARRIGYRNGLERGIRLGVDDERRAVLKFLESDQNDAFWRIRANEHRKTES